MARLNSDIKGGAYPLEEEKWHPLASLFQPYNPNLEKKPKFCDPFLNKGEAAGYISKYLNMEMYGIENQKVYADQAIAKFGYDNIIYGDSYEDVQMSPLSIDVMYLNPPYNIDETTGEFSSNRSEEKAIKHFWRYVQPNGVMVVVMYLHNLNKEIYKNLYKRCTHVYIYRFPGLHLGRYTQIAILAYKDKNAETADQNKVEERWPDFQKWLQNLPEITAGYKAYSKTPFPLPVPANRKHFEFAPNKEDWNKLNEILKHSGTHRSKQFKQIAVPVAPEVYGNPPGKLNDGQIALMLTGGILEAIEIEHDGKRGLMRGSTKRIKEKIREEVKKDPKGRDYEIETSLDRPVPFVTVLMEDGELIAIEKDQIKDFIKTHSKVLTNHVMEVFKPAYNMKVDPLFKPTFKELLVEGIHKMYPAQKHVSVALTELLLRDRYAIAACEMRFGKTPATIALIENLRKVNETKRKNPAALKTLLEKTGLKLKDVDGIKPGNVVLVVCPAGLPEDWINAIHQMYGDKAVVRRITNVVNTARFFDEAEEAGQNGSEQVYIGVATFQNVKLGEGWEAAWHEHKEHRHGWVQDENKNSIEAILTTTYARCPTTGEKITVKVGKNWKEAEPKDLDPKITKVGQKFFTGNLFDGYEKQSVIYGEKAGTLFYVPKPKRIERQDGFALFQDKRTIGLPSLGNGHVLTEDVEIVIPARKGKMLKQERFDKDWYKRDDKSSKVWKLVDCETKPNVIRGTKIVKNLVPDEEMLDPWLSKQGLRCYTKEERVREIDKYMREQGYTEYAIGDGDEELDKIFKRRKIDVYYMEPGKRVIRNPRYPLAEFIRRRYPHRVDLLVVDELHAMQGSSTDIGKAIRNLCFMAKKTLGLTGTLYGGNASSIYTILFAFNPEVRIRYPWKNGDVMHWVSDMGVIKHVVETKNEYNSSGAFTGTKRYSAPKLSESPGYNPEMMKLMLPNVVFAGLSDLGSAIPPFEERPEIVDMSEDQLTIYTSVGNAAKEYLNKRLVEFDPSFLSPYYLGMITLPDAMFQPNPFIHTIRVDKRSKLEEGKEKVVLISPALSGVTFPKEARLIERIKAMLSDNRRCIVYVVHNGEKRDIQQRIYDEITKNIPEAKTFVLKSHSPQAADRSTYIKKKVFDEGYNVMICNPTLIKEGVDMSMFSYTGFFELDNKFRVMAQAARRTWGLSQPRKEGVTVEYFAYDDLFQKGLLMIIAGKTAAADVIYGFESGALAQASDEVDLLTDLKQLISGKDNDEDIKKKMMTKEQIAESFSKIMYTSDDLKRSSWYIEEEEEEDEQVFEVGV